MEIYIYLNLTKQFNNNFFVILVILVRHRNVPLHSFRLQILNNNCCHLQLCRKRPQGLSATRKYMGGRRINQFRNAWCLFYGYRVRRLGLPASKSINRISYSKLSSSDRSAGRWEWKHEYVNFQVIVIGNEQLRF